MVAGRRIKGPSREKLPQKTDAVFYKQFILVSVKHVALVIVAEIAAGHDVTNLVCASRVIPVHFQPHASAGTSPVFTVFREPL